MDSQEKRDLLQVSTAVLTTLLAKPADHFHSTEGYAELAISYARALIEEVNKT